MASTYALPASAMTHSHNHGPTHLHSHSHSPSPNRQYPVNSPRSLMPERANGSMHSHSYSDFDIHSSRSRGHSHEREVSPLARLPTPPDSTVLPPIAMFEKRIQELPPSVSQPGLYQPPTDATEVLPHKHFNKKDRNASYHIPKFQEKPKSRITKFILNHMPQWPLIREILDEKDSRRIFYFMSLNFAFMMVQAFYGYLTDSLGLLSDSIHMFFDCLALAVGLFAAVAGKWGSTKRFPFGFGKIESLSGFGNGVFLMLISVEIMVEAMDRLADGRETKRLTELFVVSALGLAVNLVGMACFGHHGHAGHGHGHSHSHSHDEKLCLDGGHDHGHDDHDDHDGHHDHNGLCEHNDVHPGLLPKSPAHTEHSHDNENMHGIFLHVLADTMGSAAVVVSTTLIHFFGWNGWDPLASCIIAVLIFMSSIPLVKSSAKKLLLTMPDAIEYSLRDILSGVSDVRGVATYTVPRFWLGSNSFGEEITLGVIHIVASRGSDTEDVGQRVGRFLEDKGIQTVVQVEGDGDRSCWCGGLAPSRSPTASSHTTMY